MNNPRAERDFSLLRILVCYTVNLFIIFVNYFGILDVFLKFYFLIIDLATFNKLKMKLPPSNESSFCFLCISFQAIFVCKFNLVQILEYVQFYSIC